MGGFWDMIPRLREDMHFHMLLTPNDEWNISKIVQNLKLNVSRDINRIIDPVLEGEKTFSRLQEIYRDRPKFFDLKNQFHQKYPHEFMIPFPKTLLSKNEGFQWQRSFHDHVIRDERDFETHMRYIEYNPLKHHMPEGWRSWDVGQVNNENEKTFSHLHYFWRKSKMNVLP